MTISERELKRDITRLVLSSRAPTEAYKPLQPRFVSYDEIIGSDGLRMARKKVILMTKGCSVPTCTMCPFTNENLYGQHSSVSIDLLTQVQSVLTRRPDEPDYEMLALYNDGNFFSPAEIPNEVQGAIAEMAARSGIRRLVVESLPQFITEQRLTAFVERLGDVELEVGIGLQSADPFVREICVNTSFSNAHYEAAVKLLTTLDVSTKTYLMLKPPFLTEAEAIQDTLRSLDYLKSLGSDSATICPTRVARNTLVHALHRAGLYQPPNLWSIVRIIRQAHSSQRLRVACINLRGSDFESIFPDSCPQCADSIVDGLEYFSTSGSLTRIPNLCPCQSEFSDQSVPDIAGEALPNRVRRMLDRMQSLSSEPIGTLR